MDAEEALRKEGNLARFASGLFFDTHARKDILRLWRVISAVNSYVDRRQHGQLHDLMAKWEVVSQSPMRELEHEKGDDTNTRLIKNIARLKIIYGYDAAWVDAFLIAAVTRLKAPRFKTLNQSLAHVYGSSEVIGLMVAQLLRLPKVAQPAAQAEARALQWLTFVRDIAKHTGNGHGYFPQDDLKTCGLTDLAEKTARANSPRFSEFMHLQLSRYHQWQREAVQDLAYVPRRPRIAINTAIHGGNYVAKQIAKDPFIVFEQQVRPGGLRLTLAALAHSFD